MQAITPYKPYNKKRIKSYQHRAISIFYKHPVHSEEEFQNRASAREKKMGIKDEVKKKKGKT